MEQKEKQEGECLSVATNTTMACGGGSGKRKLPVCELLFEWKGRFCTAHTVSFANENRAILNAKANVWDPPGLTHSLLCFARLYLNVIPLWLWSLPCLLFIGIRKTMSGFPCQTYRSRESVGDEQGTSSAFLYCAVYVGC